ncbi:phosphatidylinositol phosphate synthase [Tomitella gaofuii]|uniref:phosphatidylinositol phosphate synthase n=1 Tax=Tomitella gaofuii TaxID=2760083 RepID=UPI0015F8A783|nr:CDP-alcohol phosphatidyltransferase family protein [Tomitella gaofuii]
MLSVFARASVSKVTLPMGRKLVRMGVTPDVITIAGTVASIAAALTLFPMGHLFWGALVIWFFVMFDMLDGATARARGGGTRFGAVLDATCDRIADGAIFAGLAWWVVYSLDDTTAHRLLLVATLICLVTSQVISYAKARAEASGLNGDGGLIERPDRLIIVLVGAGFTGIFDQPWILFAAMWLLAVGSVITVGQRMRSVRNSPGARDLIPLDRPSPEEQS